MGFDCEPFYCLCVSKWGSPDCSCSQPLLLSNKNGKTPFLPPFLSSLLPPSPPKEKNHPLSVSKLLHSFMASSKLGDDELQNLVSKLQTLLPQLSGNSTVSTAEVLNETCEYIKQLQREVDDLSERLSKQLDSMGVDFEMLKDLLLNSKF